MKKNLFIYIVLVMVLCYGCKKAIEPIAIKPFKIITSEIIWPLNNGVYSSFLLCGGNITSDGGNPIISRGVCWSTEHSSPSIADSVITSGSGVGSFQCKIYNYLLGKKYYVKAFARTSSDIHYGQEVSITPPCFLKEYGHFLSIVGPPDEADEQPTKIKLQWICVSENDNIHFDVYLDTIPEPARKIATDTTSTSIILSSLTINKTYYWKIYAWNPILLCETYTSEVRSFSTKGVTAPAVATSPVASFTSTSATLGGKVISDGDGAIIERGLFLSTSQNSEFTGTKIPVGNGTGSFSTNLSGLDINVTYYLKAYAINSAGIAYGSLVTFNLSDGSPLVTDIDGNVYNIVTIGTQTWMAENLKTTRYADGGPIYYINNETGDNPDRSYCWYDYDTCNKEIYGALYSWEAVMNFAQSSNSVPSGVQGICPTGWHLPSFDEWARLGSYLGGYSIAGGKLKLTGTSLWQSPNEGATNETNFCAEPGGLGSEGIRFDLLHRCSYWYCSTSLENPVCWKLSSDTEELSFGDNARGDNYYSVRCVKDE